VQDDKTLLRVIYIGGIEHNGSTLLGLTLGNHSQIECIGELSQLPRLGWAGDHLCACGKTITDCEYWNNVRKTWSGSTGEDIEVLIAGENRFDRNSSFLRLLLENNVQSQAFQKYSSQTKALYEAIQQVSGKPIIVDTSKRVSRAVALSLIDGIDLRLIHLVRDARAVAYSSAKTKRAQQKSWWKSAARWRAINESFHIASRVVGKDKKILIRYEDFIEKPDQTLAKIGHFIGVNLTSISKVLSSGGALAPGHIGIGNGFLQGEKEIILRPSENWPEKMSIQEQRKVWKITVGRMRLYGYEEEAVKPK